MDLSAKMPATQDSMLSAKMPSTMTSDAPANPGEGGSPTAPVVAISRDSTQTDPMWVAGDEKHGEAWQTSDQKTGSEWEATDRKEGE